MIWDDIEAAKRTMGHGNSADFWPPDRASFDDRLAKVTLEQFMSLGGVTGGDYIAERVFPSTEIRTSKDGFAEGLPEGAVGWNVYRQDANGQMVRQNPEVLPLDQVSYRVETHVIRNPEFEEPTSASRAMTARDWRVAHMFLSIARHRKWGYPIEDQMGRLEALDAWAREAGDVDLIVRVGELRERLRRRFERISTNAPRPDRRGRSYLEEAAGWHGYALAEQVRHGNTQLVAATGAADQLLGICKENIQQVADYAQDVWVQITATVQPALDGISKIDAKLKEFMEAMAPTYYHLEDNLAECRHRHLHVVRRNISPRTISRERMWVPPWRREDPLAARDFAQFQSYEWRKLYQADWGPDSHLDHVHMTC